MDKFTLYDLLGLLLPGYIFTWLLNALNTIYNITPYSIIGTSWDSNIGFVFCISMIVGAILYALNFRFMRWKGYSKVTGIYQSISSLHLENPNCKELNSGLNNKAIELYEQEIFYTDDNSDTIDTKRKDELSNLQNSFYDRMYYELDYHEKLDSAKAFQSFYFFFRHLFAACWLTLVISAIISIISLTTDHITLPHCSVALPLHISIFIGMAVSLILAKWYRKRMVHKMFWSFFTHISQTK